MDEPEAWREVGRRIKAARERTWPSARAAARAAEISDVHWRNIEAGERQVTKGLKVPPSVSDAVLARAARTVHEDPRALFEKLGRVHAKSVLDGRESPKSAEERLSALEARFDRLEEKIDLVLSDASLKATLVRLEAELREHPG